MVKLFTKAGMPDNDSCIDLHYLYPQVPIKSRLPPFTVTRGDYYRLARYSTLGKNVGEVSTCNWTENITADETMSNLTGCLNSGDFNKVKWARANIWRLCGVMMLGLGFTDRLDRIMLPCTFGNAFHTHSTPRNEVGQTGEKKYSIWVF
jgi:hypothetical protein